VRSPIHFPFLVEIEFHKVPLDAGVTALRSQSDHRLAGRTHGFDSRDRLAPEGNDQRLAGLMDFLQLRDTVRLEIRDQHFLCHDGILDDLLELVNSRKARKETVQMIAPGLQTGRPTRGSFCGARRLRQHSNIWGFCPTLRFEPKLLSVYASYASHRRRRQCRTRRVHLSFPRVHHSAGKIPPSRTRRSRSIAKSVRLVEIPVSVRTAAGGMAANSLQQSNFEVFEDNVAQDILLFRHEDTPLRIGIVLNTGNIPGRKERIDSAASSFIRESNPSNKTFVLNFDGASYYRQPQFHRGIADLVDAFVETPGVGLTSLPPSRLRRETMNSAATCAPAMETATDWMDREMNAARHSPSRPATHCMR